MVHNSTITLAMAKQLDVYRDWLGIEETARPLSYYQLLRLKPFEDDTARIRGHYRKMNAHVRKYATGDYAKQSQQLLNELARALLCLTDARRKRDYDASLGRKEEVEGRRRPFDEILLGAKTLTPEQLDKARKYADAVGLELRDAVLQQKLAEPSQVMLAYAESQGLPYIELSDIGVADDLIPQIPASTARKHSCVPVMVDDGQLLVASPNPIAPNVEETLRLRTGMPVRTVLCTPCGVNEVIDKYYPLETPAAAAAARVTANGQAADGEEEPEGLFGKLFKKLRKG